MYKTTLRSVIACGATILFANSGVMAMGSTSASGVLSHYADLAHAKYEDSLTTAKQLDRAITLFLANPSNATLDAAKAAWLASRIPYQQTEVYRFGNAIVDDWEGRVNAWPLDEGLIDYVDSRAFCIYLLSYPAALK